MKTAALSLVLLLAAASVSAVEPAPASTPAAFDRSRLDEKVTVDLKEAKLQAVLELIAKVVGVTPVIDPVAVGVKSVTLKLSETPVSAVVSRLERDFFLSIRFEGDRMVVARTLHPTNAREDEEAAEDARLLTDPSVPRRSYGSWPSIFPRQFEFRVAEPARAPSVFHLEDDLATLILPGCASPLTLVVFGPGPFDREPRVAFLQKPPELPRIGSPSKPVRLPGCAAEVEFRQLVAPVASPQEPEIVLRAGSLLIRASFFEVRSTGDVLYSKILFQVKGGRSFSGSTSMTYRPDGPVLPATKVALTGALLTWTDETVTIALVADAMREMETPETGERLTLLLGRAEQTLTLKFGTTERIPVLSTYRGGTAALVVDVEVEKPPKGN